MSVETMFAESIFFENVLLSYKFRKANFILIVKILITHYFKKALAFLTFFLAIKRNQVIRRAIVF